jgi:5-methylcytosine-specific restriction endonuclease McrA
MAKKPRDPAMVRKYFVISTLRRASLRWKPRLEVKNEGRIQKVVIKVNKSGSTREQAIWHYECNVCNGWFPDKNIQMDHISPAISVEEGWQGWDVYIEQLLADKDGWQRICRECHTIKTGKEQKIRNTAKKKLL